MNEKLTPSDQWAELNRILKNSRHINIGLIVISLVISMSLAWQLLKPPVVIKEDKKGKTYFSSQLKESTITNEDAEAFIREFVKRRYVWVDFKPQEIIDEIRPLVTDNFAKLLMRSLEVEKGKMVKVKSIEQNITNLEVKIEQGKALAIFDKVIRVNKVPLVAPTQISLNIVKKDRTSWNPIGLYVHGIIEHSEK